MLLIFMLAGPINNQKAGVKWLINNITIHISYNISVSTFRSQVASRALTQEYLEPCSENLTYTVHAISSVSALSLITARRGGCASQRVPWHHGRLPKVKMSFCRIVAGSFTGRPITLWTYVWLTMIPGVPAMLTTCSPNSA